MNKLSLPEKIKLVMGSSKEYCGVIYIGFLFISIGILFGFIGYYIDIIFFYLFGGLFIASAIFFLLWTIPSSMSYYYEKALVKKYGTTTYARLIEKEVMDNSYRETIKNSASTSREFKFIEELHYLLTFSYDHQNTTYTQTDTVGKEVFDTLKIGDTLPIQMLTINPQKSTIRQRKLKNDVLKREII